MNQTDVEECCRATYVETKRFYDTVALASGGVGFKILYSPPFLKPPILFIGYQPGGVAEDCAREIAAGAHDTWPRACEYATEDWKLAWWMRRMFGANLLSTCVGVNAIFLRAPNVETYIRNLSHQSRDSAFLSSNA